MSYNYYATLTDEEKKAYSKRSTQYNRENIKKVTVGLSHDLDKAMIKYMAEHGYKSKNAFILELIKNKIGYTD